MLVGFFKSAGDSACECRIVNFSDRIWLRPDGSATALRFFTLEVMSSPSNRPLTDTITVLTPRRSVSEQVRNLNDTCFDKAYYFNTTKTAGYDIVQMPRKDGSITDHGIINSDGLSNVLVYADVQPGVRTIDKSDAFRIRFPAPVPPGSKVEVRIGFDLGSLWTNISAPEQTPVYEVRLDYLGANGHDDAIAILGGIQNQIRIVPTMGGDAKGGGFDVFLYYPPSFVTHQPTSGTEVQDNRSSDGAEGTELRPKRIWRLRELDPGKELVGVGAGYDLICQITPRFDPPRKLTEIKEEVALVSGEMNQVKKDISDTTEKVGGLTKEVRIATLVALAAILIAVLAFFEGLSGWEKAKGLIAILVVVSAVGFILTRLKI